MVGGRAGRRPEQPPAGRYGDRLELPPQLPRAPAMGDLREGRSPDGEPAGARIRYGLFVVRIVSLTGCDQPREPGALAGAAGIMAQRWAAVRHPPDAVIRVGRAGFCIVCTGRQRHGVMNTVDDLRAAAAVPVPLESQLVLPILSIRVLFSRF